MSGYSRSNDAAPKGLRYDSRDVTVVGQAFPPSLKLRRTAEAVAEAGQACGSRRGPKRAALRPSQTVFRGFVAMVMLSVTVAAARIDPRLLRAVKDRDEAAVR